MVFITAEEILETVRMIQAENLDVRAVTMGISLNDCAARDAGEVSRLVYEKVVRSAKDLVPVALDVQRKYGIPIVNRRVAVTPIAHVVASDDPADFVQVAHALDEAAEAVGIDFVGGFGCLVQKGFSRGDEALIRSIPEAIATTQAVCSSVNVASTRAGINMDAVTLMADVLLEVARLTADRDCIGCAKIVTFCNIPEDNPFMAGAMHGSGEPELCINVAISGPGVVRNVVQNHPEMSFTELVSVSWWHR